MKTVALPFTPDTSVKPQVYHFFDEDTNTFSYIVKDPNSNACAIVDSVMELEYAAGRTRLIGADKIIAFVKEKGWDVEWIIETHVHADHLSAAPYIQEHLGGKLGIGDHINVVQETFGKIFNAGTEFQRDGSQFDRLFKDGDSYQVGSMTVNVLHTPGHTPACMTYVVRDGEGADAQVAAFVGDTLFSPEVGTARCDFPGGDAAVLYRSIRRVLALPPATRLYLCHDYPPDGRAPQPVTTVAQQRAANVHVHDGVAESDFVALRRARDATLKMPTLILPSVQVNMRAGQLAPAEDNGTRYLKSPLDVL